MFDLNPPQTMHTDRMIIRKPLLDDAQSLYDQYMADPQVPRFMSWKGVTDVSQSRWWLDRCIEGWNDKSNFEFVIEVDGIACGMIGMHPLKTNAGVGFGYVIAKRLWGRGYMTEALTFLSDWALKQDQIFRAQVFCHVFKSMLE